MDVRRYISIDPRICHGKPCFRGTRIMVSTVLELLESGQSYRQIKQGYPALTPQHMQAALHFAHQVLDGEQPATFRAIVHAPAH